jgi:polysaccharide pyruvyl transferase WcaK-like protein
MDVVLTSRLHGLVLALKNGVPAIAIDSVAGGHKVSRQAETLGWKWIFLAESIDDASLREAYTSCLKGESREMARACTARAEATLQATRDAFFTSLLGVR